LINDEIIMNFDLHKLLTIKEPTEKELEEIYLSLQKDLPEAKRNYAYTISNLRRLEYQIKDEVAKNPKSANSIALKQQYSSLVNSANALKNEILMLEENSLKVSKKKASLQRKAKRFEDAKGLNKALGLINSTLLINVIEYPVIQEAQAQLHNLAPDVRQKLNLVEVVVYALNRLPSMYATTKDGYRHHYNNAMGEMRSQIVDTVRKGIRSLLLGDPLYVSSEIPDEVFCDPAGLLSRLTDLFNRKQMRWKEVPSVLDSILAENTPDKDLLGEPIIEEKIDVNARRGKFSDITSYLKRSKLKKNSENTSGEEANSGASWKDEAIETERSLMQEQLFRLYTLKGKLKYINVTEKFLTVATLHLMAGISSDNVDLVEVAAHALNHFPQMYATNEKGLTLLRQKCQAKLPEYIEQLRKSFARVKYSVRSQSEPLYFAEFNSEYEGAIVGLTKMLDREDITPDNLIDVIKEFIA
jgi:hypothetical protein